MNSEPLFRSLASDIQALLDVAASSGQDSQEWHELAGQLHVKLGGVYQPIYPRIPHDLEHYLCDADIRNRDDDYRRSQEAEMKSYLSNWTTESV